MLKKIFFTVSFVLLFAIPCSASETFLGMEPEMIGFTSDISSELSVLQQNLAELSKIVKPVKIEHIEEGVVEPVKVLIDIEKGLTPELRKAMNEIGKILEENTSSINSATNELRDYVIEGVMKTYGIVNADHNIYLRRNKIKNTVVEKLKIKELPGFYEIKDTWKNEDDKNALGELHKKMTSLANAIALYGSGT